MTAKKLELVVFSILALLIIVVGIRLFIKPVDKLPSLSFSTYRYDNSNMYTQASSGSVSNVSNLYINWVSGFVEIIPYDGKAVKFEEHSENGIQDSERLCYWADGDTLRIQFSSSGLHRTTYSQKKLLVYIPANTEIKKLSIDVTSADVRIKEINAEIADFSAVSGDFTINSLNARNINQEAVSGSFTAINISFVSFEGEAVSGNINIDLSSKYKPESIDIETVSGDIKLGIPADFGFELDLDTVSGDIKSAAETYMVAKNKLKHGDGFINIELETVSGDVTLK